MDLLCGGCGRTVKLDDVVAGQTVPCPHCGRDLAVPSLADLTAPQTDGLAPLAEDEQLGDDFLTKAKLALKKKLLVQCGACGERLTVEQRLAGKVARCPACGDSLRIPAQAEEPPFEPAAPPAPAEEVMAEAQAQSEELNVAEPSQQPAAPPPGVPHLPPPEAAAPAEAPAETDQAVDAELAAAAGRPRVVRRRLSRRRGVPLPLVVLAAMLAGVTLVGGWYLLFGLGAGQEPDLARGRGAGPGAEPVQPPPPRPLPGPTASGGQSPPTATGPETTTRPPEVTPPGVAGVNLVSAALRVLGGDGFVPAPPGQAFLEVRLALTAGPQPVNLDPSGGAITLATPRGQFRPLGLSPAGAAPLAAQAGVLAVGANQARDAALVFLVPEDLDSGTLTLTGLGEIALSRAQRPAVPSPAALAGSYAEAGRYLKLSFDDPFLERLRAAGRQSLAVTPLTGGDRFALTLTPLGYNGQARALGEGAFMAVLNDGAANHPCQLRLADDGRKLILYLADRPFHQIVYERQ